MYMQLHVNVYTNTHVHAITCTCIYMYTCTHAHTITRICIYMYTCTCRCTVSVCLFFIVVYIHSLLNTYVSLPCPHTAIRLLSGDQHMSLICPANG